MRETGAVFDTAPLVFYLGGVHKAFGREPRRLVRGAETGRIRIAVPTVCLFEVARLEETREDPPADLVRRMVRRDRG